MHSMLYCRAAEEHTMLKQAASQLCNLQLDNATLANPAAFLTQYLDVSGNKLKEVTAAYDSNKSLLDMHCSPGSSCSETDSC